MGSIQPPNQCVLGVLSLVVKRLGPEAEHSPLCSAEVMNVWWSYTSTPSVACVVKPIPLIWLHRTVN